MTSAISCGSANGNFSSSPPSKASGLSCVSSPLSSTGGKSFTSSPSGTWSSPQDSTSFSNNGNAENCLLYPNHAKVSCKSTSTKARCGNEDLDNERVRSWSQYLDTSGELRYETPDRKHTLDMSQLFLGQKFACGSYSRLYRGQYKNQEVAVKMVLQPKDDEKIANKLDRQFGQEVNLLSRLHHANVVEFVGAMRKPPVFCIITEYLPGGSLRALLHKVQPHSLSMDKVLGFAFDVARGMEYLHSQGVLHLDLKSHNLVLGENGHLKVTDFGVARLQSECASMTPDSGTYRWMAPEMISNKAFSMKADVYSFGIILWEIFTGQTPYEEMSIIQAAYAVVHKDIRPQIPDCCPRPLKQLMEECWSANPDKRPSFWQIVQRLDGFQDCVRRNENMRPWKFDCEKQNRLSCLVQKLKPMCFAGK